jgi:hypothetical protein
MRNSLWRVGWVVVAASIGAAPVSARPQAAPATTPAPDVNLAVAVTYKGPGTVKAGNELSVWLFTTPVINAESRPIGVQVLQKNGSVAEFRGVSAPTVYIAVVYDEKGTYDEQGPPPTGTPSAIYSDKAGAPIGVTPGKGTKVSVTFDASHRMP